MPAETTPSLLPEKLEKLGWIPTWIVGRRYYAAIPPVGAALYCERQPDNPHDADAIAVYVPGGGQAGHLPRYDAAYLAPLLDRGIVRLEARLAGPDDPDNRTPIRLEVLPAERAADLAGRANFSTEALWHHQLLGLWQNRAHYTHAALAAFRDEVRPLFHAGGLWPETQLFYRLLKGTVADGVAEAEQIHQEQLQREAAEAARRHAVKLAGCRTAITCRPCGALRPFGYLSVLPLRALYPAGVIPLATAIREGTAAITCGTETHSLCKLQMRVEKGHCVLAVRDEELDTTLGRVRVLQDSVFAPGLVPEETLYVVKTERGASKGRRPVFLTDAVMPEPALPDLPQAATGFALFRGAKPLEIALFAHRDCAVAALSLLRARSWHLKPATPVPSAAEAFAAIQPIFRDAAFNITPPYLDFDGTAPGISGDALILNNGLVYLRVEIKEDDDCQKKRVLN